MTWRDDKRTDKQYDAIINMRSALGWTCTIPETKGECCDLTAQLKIRDDYQERKRHHWSYKREPDTDKATVYILIGIALFLILLTWEISLL